MKLKVTLSMILVILLMMLGAGGASAYMGYLMGREALKAVTQPETDSEQTNEKKPVGGSHKGLNIIQEKTVLVNVYNFIHQKQTSSDREQSLIERNKTSEKPNNLIKPESFPLTHRSSGVTMEIAQAKREGNSVTLSVNLKNESTSAVRFLYSFLDVRDEQNRPLSAIADGLPGEIPPNGEIFQGRFMIPVVLLDNAQNVSLTLKDYPEQKLKLELSSIPISQ
jgi:hypothetical protein